MSAAVFADTFYWIALTYPDDSAHTKAVEFDCSPERTLTVTTEEILIEFLTFFGGKGKFLRTKALLVVRRILADASIRILPQKHDTFALGLELYARRLDKAYSLTDCISMATMRGHGIEEVLTDDRHFEQEGFGRYFVPKRQST